MVKEHELKYGVDGCLLTWQNPFPEEVTCACCGKEGARLAFVLQESGKKEHACNLYQNDPDGEGFWVHDSAAFAVYLCRDINCPEKATAKWNQA